VRRIASLILLTSIVLSCRGKGKNDAQYKTEKVDRGDVTMTVTATGTLSAVTTVQIGSQVSGVIARLYADFNSQVTKGQLLAELDPTPFQAQVEQRQADLTKAKVEAGNAKISYDREARLAKAGLTATADVDTARAQYESANAQVQQASAALQQSMTNLRYAKIVSPIDGIVVDRQYDVGQTVAASFQAPTLFSIAQDLTKMQVQADVDQSDIGRVSVGQPVRFTVDAYPDEEFRGRISQMRLNATVAQNVVSYPVIIEVPNPDGRLRPKMTANVTIEVATVRNVLRIPNAALRFKPDTSKDDKSGAAATSTQASNTGGSDSDRGALAMGRRQRGLGGAAGAFGGGGPKPKKMQTVYVLSGGEKKSDQKLTPVQVRTGISDGRFTEVVEGGLKPGDLIVVGLATSKVEGPAAFGGAAGPGGGQRGGGGGRGGR
jgi:HlyD family secretion protein